METAEGEAALSAALFTLDAETGRCLSIERIYLSTTGK
jgi:calcineurin-like phosphoesterase